MLRASEYSSSDPEQAEFSEGDSDTTDPCEVSSTIVDELCDQLCLDGERASFVFSL